MAKRAGKSVGKKSRPNGRAPGKTAGNGSGNGGAGKAGERANGLTYAAAGVDIHEGDRFVDLIRRHVRSTHTPRVLDRPGGFAGLFRLDFNEKLFKRNYREPALVGCTDGVGTKVKIACELQKFDTIGIDLVAMNVNDLIVEGAEPLFFLDYLACHKIVPETLAEVVKGVAAGCKQAGAALLGGETAEMPAVYAPGDMDLAGFAVGVVELDRAMDATRVEPGDIVLGLESDGVHSNGYALVRAIVDKARLDLRKVYADLDKKRTLGEVLLTPTRIYAKPVTTTLRTYTVKKIVTGMAHITGSGLAANLERALHPRVDAVLRAGSWPTPKVFPFLQRHGNVRDAEMASVFNMGLGYCMIVRPAYAAGVAKKLKRTGERVHVVGKIVKGTGRVGIE